MLHENIKAIRKSKGLSQEELAIKLNVVRQTISKWEQGVSVPDDLKAISEKLEIINLQLTQRKSTRRKIFHWLFICLCAVIGIIYAVLLALNGSYLRWNYNDPETAVAGAAFHAFEWLFVRFAPIILIGTIVGIILTRKKV